MSRSLTSFMAFNSIAFVINFVLAFNCPAETIIRSLFLSGFNLCLLIADFSYLWAKLPDYLESLQYKTLDKINQESLEEHNEQLVNSPVSSEENSDGSESSESGSEDEPTIIHRHLTTSIGVKKVDDILSPEECENLNFDTL